MAYHVVQRQVIPAADRDHGQPADHRGVEARLATGEPTRETAKMKMRILF
jgi:hypothetical protein